LGNQDLIHKKAIIKKFDGLAWLMQNIQDYLIKRWK